LRNTTAAANPTTINNQSSGTYALTVSGGTLNASDYQFRNMNTNGLRLSGSPTISSLNGGDFALAVNGGNMITIDGGVFDQNPSKIITGTVFATSSGISAGYNVYVVSASTNAWTFSGSAGNYDGENFDFDGADTCGSVRWDDSVCLLVDQTHFRWRNDDGGEGVPASEWYNTDWGRRKRIRLTDTSGTSTVNYQAKVVITYDSDMQSNFGDLRFTDSSGTTTLNYWIESYVSSATSTVWVKIPSMPANGNADIYMYYKNVGVVSTTGTGTSTFIFFDDFENGNLSNYSGDTGAGYFTVGATFAYQGIYGLDAVGNETAKTIDGIYRTGTTIPQGSTIRWFQYVNAGQSDEPCTLFGVQSPGSNNNNYALCFDEYPADRLEIVKNVSNNDGSGTMLASTTVTWVTGWYEAKVDWRTNNTIYASVYDSNGALFATTTVTDSSYTSGGMGFSFWGQHGGWDQYTAQVYAPSVPTYTFGLEQLGGGASWRAAEDTTLSNLAVGENVRLRFSIYNSGLEVTNQNFRLQSALMDGYANCLAVPQGNFSDAATQTGGCGTSPICMATSSQFSNRASTTQLMSIQNGTTYTPGQIMEDPSNETSNMNLPQNNVAEVEYNFKLTAYATGSEYCFRTTDGGTSLDNYTINARLSLQHAPTILSFTLNGDQNIGLTESTTTVVTATGTVQDLNGYADLSFSTSTFYRSGVSGADQCVNDENNCYQIASSSCSFNSCVDTTCNFSCAASIQYFADPTDPGSAYAGQSWLPQVTITDLSGLTDSTSGFGVDVYTLHALGTFGEVDYGTLSVGSTTENFNASTTLQNTGNDTIDIDVSGTDLVATGDSITVDNQIFATSTFTYSSCTICSLLSGTSTHYEVDLLKPTSTSTPITDVLYWGLNVPTNTAGLEYFGVANFDAVSD
jgi:hypothetical protein